METVYVLVFFVVFLTSSSIGIGTPLLNVTEDPIGLIKPVADPDDVDDDDYCLTKWANVCQNGGVCIDATKDDFECDCTTDFKGKTCQESNSVGPGPCVNNPCQHDGICVPAQDGSFSCDCPIEFLGKLCAETDPCAISNDCKQGSTCSRKNDIEYECMCRVPYKGDHCDEEDLCLIDEGDCIDDLIPGPKCYPCGKTETCQKIAENEYSCWNSLNIRLRNFPIHPSINKSNAVAQNATSNWLDVTSSWFLAKVVIWLLIFYLLMLFIAIMIDKRNKMRPRLIIMGEVCRITVDTFYLLTVETGSWEYAGTMGKIYCEIFGDELHTKVLVVNNYLMNAMNQNDKTDFLFRTPRPLGNILKIQFWFDSQDVLYGGIHPFWYCRDVAIRNIKTEEIWFFFVRKWLGFEPGEVMACEILVATEAEIVANYVNDISLRGYFRQLREHHLWLNVWCCPAYSVYTKAERITTSMALYCCYMFIVMAFYGFPVEYHHHHLNPKFDQVQLTTYYPVFSIGSKASLIGVVCGYMLTLLFRLIRRHVIPALIVWDYPHRSTHKTTGVQTDTVQFVREQTDTAQFLRGRRTVPMPMVMSKNMIDTEKWILGEHVDPRTVFPNFGLPLKPPGYNNDTSSSLRLPFRIPSTDILETENWILGLKVDPAKIVKNIVQKHSYGDSYIHQYHSNPEGKAIELSNRICTCNIPTRNPNAARNRIKIGKNEKIPPPCSCNYKNNTGVAQLSFITEALAKRPPQPVVVYSKDGGRKHRPFVKSKKIEEIVPPRKPLCREATTSTTALFPESLCPSPWKLELCSIEHDDPEAHHCLHYHFVWIAWLINIGLICWFCGIMLHYGFYFTYHQQINWFLSTLWAVLESFFFLQPIKVLVIYIIHICKQRCEYKWNKDYPEMKPRFKLLWMTGEMTPIDIWRLNYLIHPLQYNGEYEIDDEKCSFPVSSQKRRKRTIPPQGVSKGSQSQGGPLLPDSKKRKKEKDLSSLPSTPAPPSSSIIPQARVQENSHNYVKNIRNSLGSLSERIVSDTKRGVSNLTAKARPLLEKRKRKRRLKK